MNIDWSKAPEGFPLWLEGTNADHQKHSGWYRKAGEVYQSPDGGQWRSSREGQFFTVHCKPDQAQWNGEGLPPVGTVCELHSESSLDKTAVDRHRYEGHIGREVKIIAHHDLGDGCIAAVYSTQNDFSFEYHSMVEGNFRPIRTAEQIAADERKTQREELASMISGYDGFDDPRDRDMKLAEYLLDHDYRKQAAD